MPMSSSPQTLPTKYHLPDLLQILVSPPLKKPFKRTVKSSVREFWHTTLLDQAASLPSLRYLRPAFLPLGQGPHPLWWTCRSSPSAVRAATVQAKMLSGRYRSCWSGESGACRLPGCGQVPGDVAHILSGECPALKPVLARTMVNINDILAPYPILQIPVETALQSGREVFSTYILDPSTDPSVISLVQ